jgi:hypothetical protein
MKSINVKHHESNVHKKPYEHTMPYRFEMLNGTIRKRKFDKMTETKVKIEQLNSVIEQLNSVINKFGRIKEIYKKEPNIINNNQPI